METSVTWLLVVLGWLVVWGQQHAFSKRAAMEREIESLIARLEGLRVKAIQARTRPGDPNSLASTLTEVRFEMHQFSREAQAVAKRMRESRSKTVRKSVVEFRVAVSGGDGESIHRPPVSEDSSEVRRIWIAYGSLIEALKAL